VEKSNGRAKPSIGGEGMWQKGTALHMNKGTYKEGKELLLHEVNLADRKDSRVSRPVLVLGRLVVEVLCGDD
jgi:hypothetical protein